MKMYFDMEQKPACDVALQTETGEVFTYGELREQIAEFQHAVRRRSFVFLLCENSPGAVIGYLGCLNAGAVPLLLNAQIWHCCWQHQEVQEAQNWCVYRGKIWKAMHGRLWSICI